LFWVAALAACVALWGPRWVAPIMAANGYRRVEARAELLREVAHEFEIDPNLLAGVMLAESSGRIDAQSHAGALGLFQLMLPTARERAELLGLEAPTRDELLSDARLNARLAGSYLRWLLRRYGAEEPALVAYNAGPGRLDRWTKEFGGYAAWREARESTSEVLGYARKVLAYRDRFRERGVVTPPFDQPPPPPDWRAAQPPIGPPLAPAEASDAASPDSTPSAPPSSSDV
jgi:soluble lytic murein transglycosylase-like protein